MARRPLQTSFLRHAPSLHFSLIPFPIYPPSPYPTSCPLPLLLLYFHPFNLSISLHLLPSFNPFYLFPLSSPLSPCRTYYPLTFTSSFIPVSCPLSPLSCPFLFYQLPPLPSSKPFPMHRSPLKPSRRRHKLSRLDAPPWSRTNISSEGESFSIHWFFHPQVMDFGWASQVETTVEHLLHLKKLRKLLQVILLGMMTQSVMRSTLTLPQIRGLHRGSWGKPMVNLEGTK